MKTIYRAFTIQSRHWGYFHTYILGGNFLIFALFILLLHINLNYIQKNVFLFLFFLVFFIPFMMFLYGLGMFTVMENDTGDITLIHTNRKRTVTLKGPFKIERWWNYIFTNNSAYLDSGEYIDFGEYYHYPVSSTSFSTSSTAINLVFEDRDGHKLSLAKELFFFQEYTYNLPYSLNQIPEKDVIILFGVSRLMKKVKAWKKAGYLKEINI